MPSWIARLVVALLAAVLAAVVLAFGVVPLTAAAFLPARDASLHGYDAPSRPTTGAANTRIDTLRVRTALGESSWSSASSSEYHLRARQYDPATGRFDGPDPVESPLRSGYGSAYAYVDARPTVLGDPAGLDPSFNGRTIGCERNADLCKLIYGAGFKDQGCRGECMRHTLTTLDARGITLEQLVSASRGKGKIINASDGLSGAGLYFVGGGESTIIRPPQGPHCGLVCSLGKAATQTFGCDSQLECAVQMGLIIMPGGAEIRCGARAAESAPLFGQTTASAVFRNGPLAGRTIGDVAAALRAGDATAADLPVDVIVRSGETIGLNTRSMLARRRAGIPVKDWVINDVTGNPAMERLLTERLARNGLNGGTPLLRITGAGPNASSLR